MIKLFITDFRKKKLWGDICQTKGGYYPSFKGSIIEVKILGIWFTYNYYLIQGHD